MLDTCVKERLNWISNTYTQTFSGNLKAHSVKYLVKGTALVIVPLRQAVPRISADERSTRVGVAHRVNVGGGRRMR